MIGFKVKAMILDDLLPRLEKLTRAGDRQWIACCPAHDDRNPSLSVRDDDGRALLHCFAGCTFDSIKEALGESSVCRVSPLPEKPADLYRPPKPTYEWALNLWEGARDHDPAFHEHPYAARKGVSHNFAARRGFDGKDVILVPQRDWGGNLVGVERIYSDGTKRTLGSKGHLIVGCPEDAYSIVHVVEGWATAWAVSQQFNKHTNRPHSVIVAFGKNRLIEVAEEAQKRMPNAIYVHHEGEDNRDFWDITDAGEHMPYITRVMREAEELGL